MGYLCERKDKEQLRQKKNLFFSTLIHPIQNGDAVQFHCFKFFAKL